MMSKSGGGEGMAKLGINQPWLLQVYADNTNINCCRIQ